MPYKKPLIKKGVREPPYLHYLKLCWFEYHFQDVTDETSKKYFIENFFEIAQNVALFETIEKNYGISWNFYNKDGSRKTYNYETMWKHGYFKKYEWDSQYETFKIDKLKHTHDTACERIERSKDIDTITDIKQMHRLDKKIASASDAEEIQKYQRAKTIIFDRILERLGLKEKNLNVNKNLKFQTETEEENIQRFLDAFK